MSTAPGQPQPEAAARLASPATLAGRLVCRPGQPPPHNLRSSRPDLVARLTSGRPAQALPGLLASLFSLCGQAHRLCATLALQAASGNAAPPTPAQRQSLRQHTLREHLQRITLDWPRQLGDASAAESDAAGDGAARRLASCPLWTPTAAPADAAAITNDALASTADWLQCHLFGQPLRDWLTAWDAAPAAALQAWCQRRPSPTAGLLAALLADPAAAGSAALPGATPLRVHADAAALRALAAQLQADAGWPRQPRWQAECAETGSWTRLAEPAPQRFDSAALRLGARLAEVARLALPDDGRRQGCDGLALGALALAPGQAIAWVEMARGLLLHWLQLAPAAAAQPLGAQRGGAAAGEHGGAVADQRGDAVADQRGGALVQACVVIAPTDWNFHPAGAVAAALASTRTPAALQALLAAYDPCVPCDLDTLPATACAPGLSHA